MRKYILMSAFLLGAASTMAGNHYFVGKVIPFELINGQQTEMIIQQEFLEEELPAGAFTIQQELSHQVIDDEKIKQFLNKIRIVEKEIQEELPV